MILVTGANGKTGRALVAALSARGAAVKGFVRDPAQTQLLEGLGATTCSQGDLGDPTSLLTAMDGVEQVVHVGPPMHPDEVSYTVNVVKAAVESNVARLIYYSVMHPLRREVRHHRLKLDAEEHLVESGLTFTIVEPIRYMQHLEPIWKTVINDGIHEMPFSTEVKFNVVDLLDLAEAVAEIALTSGHEFATYELAGPEALSQNDMAQIISRVLGTPVEARALPLDTLRARAIAGGASDDRVEQMLLMNEHYDRFGFLGNSNVLRWLLGREPTRYVDYVRRLAASSNQ